MVLPEMALHHVWYAAQLMIFNAAMRQGIHRLRMSVNPLAKEVYEHRRIGMAGRRGMLKTPVSLTI